LHEYSARTCGRGVDAALFSHLEYFIFSCFDTLKCEGLDELGCQVQVCISIFSSESLLGISHVLNPESIGNDDATENGHDTFSDNVAIIGAIQILDVLLVNDCDVGANDSVGVDNTFA